MRKEMLCRLYIIRMVAILIACHCWLSTVTAATDADATGDSIYNRMVEMSLRGEHQQLGKEKDKALLFFQQHQQWEHYYYIASLCTMSKVMHEGQTMAGLRECRRLYEFARDHHHDLGRGIVMTQIGWLYSYIGDHEEGVRQMQEAFRLLRRHPLRRENILALYHYAYALELTGRYDEEARILRMAKPLVRGFEWGDTATIVYHTYHDNLLNAEALLAVRQGRLDKAERLVNRLLAKIANGDEQNEYEALRAIAEYYKARGDYALALATTDRMQPMARNSGLQWGLGLLRTEILRKLGRSDEAYDQLRPMIDLRSSDRLGQLRQQLTEMETMTELDELRIHRHKMQFWYAVIIALVIIIALCVVTVLRHRSARRLQRANSELQRAYDQLEETTTAKERIESELRIARDIQRSMVPSQFPTCDRLDIYATMTPAREVGGDLYDVLLLPSRPSADGEGGKQGMQLYFCVGDVSGKGVPASLFMAQAIRLFRALAKLHAKPEKIATYMNNELAEDNDSGMFVTMFIGLLDIDTGHLSFCNCGHNPPLIGIKNGERRMENADFQFLEMIPNVPIGLFPGIEFEGEAIDDIRQRPLLIYTDGLNEAENTEQQQLGDDRLLEIVAQQPFTTARELIDRLTAAVEHHRNGADPNDDLTMMALQLTE